MTTYHMHLVSDATGETVNSVARACLVQFEGAEPIDVAPTLLGFAGLALVEASKRVGVRSFGAYTALGFLMRKGGFSIVCLIIGFILGDDFELALRQAVLMNSDDLSVLFQSPIAMVFLALTVFFCWHFGFRNKKPRAELKPE